MLSFMLFVDLAALVLVFKLLQAVFFSKPKRRVPPGPKPLPFLGNAFDMPGPHLPNGEREKVLSKWADLYGEITYLDLSGTPFYILSNLADAVELFEKQGTKTSGRPELVMCGELCAWNESLVLSPYDERWRSSRKLLHQFIGGRGQMETTLAKFGELEEAETHASLRRILKDPEHLEEHIRKTAGAIILKMTYGFDVKEGKDELVELIEQAVEGFSVTGIPGTFLVDLIPWLRYVPSWFPGAGWKRKADKWRALTMATIHIPYEKVIEQMNAGITSENFVTLNQDFASNEERKYTLQTTATSLYAGGADTSVSAIYSFFLAMILHPEVQRKAQEEIDSVVRNDRLPTFQDRPRLPYVNAIVSEVLRWMPVITYVTRKVTEDITFKGYEIPSGALIQANVWHYLHDPNVHPDPEAFKPERFLKTETHEPERDPRTSTFGFGRRICPGLNIAEASVFISCAMYLAVFDISKAVVNGVEVTPQPMAIDGVISHPKHFPCSIKPRSPKAEALILATHD